MIRQPAVAGLFYPAEPEALRREVEALAAAAGPAPAPGAAAPVAVLVPHAGYVYSGRIAAVTYRAAPLPGRAVILCPNHTGRGAPIAVRDEGAWRTPLGDAPIDAALARDLARRCPAARSDAEAHRREHALEVQIPFLQVLVPGFRFVPVCVGTLHLPALLDLGRALAEAIAAAGGEALIVISSDFSHYIPAALAERQDRKAIDRVLALDPEGLHRVVLEDDISMCGVAPAVAGLEAARRLGAVSGRLVAYGNSGEASGDTRSVVGYAGIVLSR
jgi:hypothetical protein